jgi:hypothetical protein
LPGARDSFVVAVVAPPRDLILTVPDANGPVTSWEHLVEPVESHGSRLIVRSRVARGWKQMARNAGTVGQRLAPIGYVYRFVGHLPGSWLIAIARLGHRWMESRHSVASSGEWRPTVVPPNQRLKLSARSLSAIR